jgi:hypothetical protein
VHDAASRRPCSAGYFSAADPDERFELLLDIFVDRLAQRATAR